MNMPVDAHGGPARPNLVRPRRRPVLVAGGSGFIGCNLAESLLADGHEVIVLDNLSRPGVEQNFDWLEAEYGGRVHKAVIDVRDAAALSAAVADAGAVFHYAAQTAVTTSLVDPREDFSVNALGTFNMLEAVRAAGRRIPVIFSSTNKVYGGLGDLAVSEHGGRYLPDDAELAAHGIGEAWPLDFCTPYGCSKGAADQYVLDYAKSFGMPTAVMRMSCIYGPHQFGTEDQGWVAHFLIRALAGEPITIYGDGKQVRDILNVRDAVAAYRAVLANIEQVKGQAFNLGGGPDNAISLDMLLGEIGHLVGRPVTIAHGEWRAGDQLYFVADTSRLSAATGWHARIGWRQGVAELCRWLADNRADKDAAVGATRRRIPA
jgi:CDP-paratose 2-epimerase